MKLNELSNYLKVDIEATQQMESIPRPVRAKLMNFEVQDDCCADMDYAPVDETSILHLKYCPKCKKIYDSGENFCFDCLVALRNADGSINIKTLKTNPKFTLDGENHYEGLDEILTQDNLNLINEFNFSKYNLKEIITNIKRTALRCLDSTIRENEIDLDHLDIDEKILLFSKSFVNVKYKSYGQELGEYVNNTITLDERLSDSLMITTLIHELSHFLLNEILAETLAKILNANKNSSFDLIASYILSDTNFCRLIDEYCAHSTEGRFTVYGFQDYSSFISILEDLNGEMDRDDIEITKSIGNTFAGIIKGILESFIDEDLRDDIKDQFFTDRLDEPNYAMLKLENTDKLTVEGFLKAIWLILSDGFASSMENITNLEKYLEMI